MEGQNDLITIKSTEDEVLNFLKNYQLEDKKFKWIKKEKIDGEALILLIAFKLEYDSIKLKRDEMNIISPNIKKQILDKNDDIINDKLYQEINEKELTELWELEDLDDLDIGKRLKYLKYLIIRDQPPLDQNAMDEYLKKIFGENFKKIKEDFEDLTMMNAVQINEKCNNWQFNKEDIFILHMILEIIKNRNRNEILKVAEVQQNSNDISSKNLFYCLVEVYDYETSENVIAHGVRNPIDEFKKICSDLNIEFSDECKQINFGKAQAIELSSYMVWGSKESLSAFLQNENILNDFNNYIERNRSQDKQGIYLYINLSKKFAYIIIYPGKFGYEYSRISEPNDKILLTLIRYGFSLSSNSILCLSKEEAEKFKAEGYNIFTDNDDDAFEPERNRLEINRNIKKIFKIGETKSLTEDLVKLQNKEIIELKLNNHNLLVKEELRNFFQSMEKKMKFEDFRNSIESKYDFYFEKEFNLPMKQFYLLIRENNIFMKNNKNDEILIEEQLKDVLEKKINDEINNLFEEFFNKLLNLLFIENKFKCQFCQKSIKEKEEDLFIQLNNYFHEECYKKNNVLEGSLIVDKLNLESEYYKLYFNIKSNILNKSSQLIKVDEISNFFTAFEKSLKTENYITEKEKQNLYREIESFKITIFNNIYNQKERKDHIIENELKKYQEIDQSKFQELSSSWIEKWKNKINEYYESNKDNIKYSTIFKTSEKINNNNTGNRFEITLKYEIKKKIDKKIIVNLYKFMPYQNQKIINLSDPKEVEKREIIDNYYSLGNKEFYVYRNNVGKYRIYLHEKNPIEFFGLYDYDIISRTLFVYKKEDNIKKFTLFNDKNNNQIFKYYKDLSINSFFEETAEINNIRLIPCSRGIEKQNVLIFEKDNIFCFGIKDNNSGGLKLNLSEKFGLNNFNFNDFQFIIYFDFILILKYKNDSHLWEGKVFSLYKEDDSLFKEIDCNKIELQGIDQSSRFSLAQMREGQLYLIAANLSNGSPKIMYWEIFSQISGKSKDFITTGKNETEIKIPSGNCVVNYFYHCFSKYPIIGAIRYNYNKYEPNKILKLHIFLEKKDPNKIMILEEYIKELKNACQNKKKIDDINRLLNLDIIEYKSNIRTIDTSLGDLLIKFLELIPVQIAKIMENKFNIMSNGENLDQRIKKEIRIREDLRQNADIDKSEYPEFIDFCMKESFFNYYKLPVIVICCFGTQSIGKSTFLNELTGSLFDVSGMRCTEGIWMAVKLFMHSKKGEGKKCVGRCQFCDCNDCYLYYHYDKKIKCICENCMCGQNCFFNKENNENQNFINCNLKCSLEKGHENILKCCVENCDCNCKCNCICKSNNHNHLCEQCKIKEECNCECNCRHLCRYPALLHNFICVCLDFEGLGTFERSYEQDIQMALVGSAIGNNIIFRTNNSYDRFTEETLKKLSKGSQRIKNKIENLFGGSLIFSPRDVVEENKIQLRDEFQSKIKNSVSNWEDTNNNLKYPIFGLFDDYIFAATPTFKGQKFYNILRNKFTYDFIGNNLKLQRHPIYPTGQDFYENLKEFLCSVSSGDFDFLTNRREKNIENYISLNKKKAYEVMANYEEVEEQSSDYFTDFHGLKIYNNKDYLSDLKIDLTHNKVFQPDDGLIIDNLENLDKIQIGDYNLDEYNLIIKINKNDSNNSTFMSITNLPDYGLILMIPKYLENKNKITYNDICDDLFKLWKSICQKIQFKEKNKIIINFKIFIKSLIDRRSNNVSKWLEKILENYENLKSLKQKDSTLDSKWIMCNINCKECKYQCYQRFEHDGKTHDCSYGHKCEEECFYCKEAKPKECKYKEKGCNNKCSEVSGHAGIHTCKHGHPCKGECKYSRFTRDCEKICKIDYPHEESHNCKIGAHHCKENCDYTGARKCQKECKLEYPHPNKEEKHTCKADHLCPEYCRLKGKARVKKVEGCDEDNNEFCSKPYNHEVDEGDDIHDCGKNHICKEKCSKNCSNFCELIYNTHGTNHDCGKNDHVCGKPCPFSSSKNCKKTCFKRFEHTDTDSDKNCICELKTEELHDCDKKCRICGGDCAFKRGHDESQCGCGNCVCGKRCFYPNCDQICNKKTIHDEHKCASNSHNCGENCSYRGCRRSCKIKLEANPEHKLESLHDCLETHYCNEDNICYLDAYSSNCRKRCKLEVDKNGNHINNSSKHLCAKSNEKFEHRCKEECYLYSNSDQNICQRYCNVILNETNYNNHQHDCGKGSDHKCKYNCILYILDNNNEPKNCGKSCQLFPHNGNIHIHKCNNNNHICHSKCTYINQNDDINGSRGCKIYCKKNLGHPGNEHNCEEQHKCNKKCPYCTEKCLLPYQHPESKCKFPTKHLCGQTCSFIDGTCGGLCTKDKGHENYQDSIHKCDLPENKHSCLEKCLLCNENCRHARGHDKNNISSIICNKCHNANCKLVEKVNIIGRVHLCGNTHECKEICQMPGICEISKTTFREFTTNDSRRINFDLYEKPIKKEGVKCGIKIKEYEISHPLPHICKPEKANCTCEKGSSTCTHFHQCGFECQQCGHFCTLPYDHFGLHNCYHGNIENARIITSNASKASVKKNNIVYNFDDNEKVNVFRCEEYCDSQDQGHTHLLTVVPFLDANNVREFYKNDKHYYECKCPYFWKNVLKFDKNINKQSLLCNFYCNGDHENEPDEKIRKAEKIYCKLPLWHEGEAHPFECSHSNENHTIFLVDQSGSMECDSVKPNRKYLKNDNMLGAAIEAILEYCQARAGFNPYEKCSLIGYESKSHLIFEFLQINKIDEIKAKCVDNLKPTGGTYFYPAFIMAKPIVDEIKKKGNIPVIILLTDGLDFEHEKTLNYIQNEVNFIYNNFLLIIVNER